MVGAGYKWKNNWSASLKILSLWVQEIWETPSMANRKKAGHRNILLKLLKTEEKFLIILQDIVKKKNYVPRKNISNK